MLFLEKRNNGISLIKDNVVIEYGNAYNPNIEELVDLSKYKFINQQEISIENNIENEKPAQEKTGKGEYLRYKLTKDGISPRLIPGKSNNFVAIDSDEHDERGWITESAEMRVKMVNKRMSKLEKLQMELQEPEFFGAENGETLLVGWGSTYGPIREAVKRLNEKNDSYGALIFGDIFPLPKKLLQEKAAKAKQIINIEQNATGQLASLIRENTGIACTSSVLKYDGRQLSVDEIVDRLRNGV